MRVVAYAKHYLKWLRWKLVTERSRLDDYKQEHGTSPVNLKFPEDCYKDGFEIAFDVDTTPVQYAHIAYTYPTGALCGTQLLWFHGGPLTKKHFRRVDCKVCLHLWKKRGFALPSEPDKETQ